MKNKREELLELVNKLPLLNGLNDTLIPGFKIICSLKKYDQLQSIYKPSLCVILQGAKDVMIGDKIFTYTPGEYIFCSVEVPVTGRVTKASLKEPYLCLMLEIEPSMVFDVLNDHPYPRSSSDSHSGAFVNKADPKLHEAFIRLVQSLDTPSEARFLSSMIIKEIIFRILNDTNGAVVREMGIAGSQTQRITHAIGLIKKKFDTTLNIEHLAHEVGMSSSSFHKYFKVITNLSPLQYQKQIRLQEARRILLSEFSDAATVAFQVGYESPSQFSREYSRLFGNPPKKDIKLIKV